MNLKQLFLALSLILVSAFADSQSCDCYIVNADSIYPHIPMTMGTDIGYPPYYHCNNCSSQAIVLPFNFCFYGKNYDTVYVNNKGNLTFNNPAFQFSSKGFPMGNDTLMLAPYYADVDDSPKIVLQHIIADISYTLTATHLVVQWGTVGYNVPDCDFYNNFQITITNGSDPILPTKNNVSYCYSQMQWASGDSGQAGFNGIPGKIGVNKGDGIHYAQFGAFDYHGYTYFGPYDSLSELYWLDNRSFIFNTCVSGNKIPPVIIKSDSCLSDTVCAGDSLKFNFSFLCPQQGQKAVLSVSSPGISGFLNDTVSRNSIYSVKTTLVPRLQDTGAHIITIVATDNSNPPLKDSMQFKVFIKNCDSTVGIGKIQSDNSPFSVYPNPSRGKFTIQLLNSQTGITSIVVFNVLGEEVYSQLSTFNSQFSIDLSTQPKGVYFIKAFDGKTMTGADKVIIQ